MVHDLKAAESMAGGAGSSRGTGGMASKLRAARIATEAGIETWIVGGGGAGLEALARGDAPGTRIPAGAHPPARKAWLAQQPVRGRIEIDEGAARALEAGRSLLPRGVVEVHGRFGFGEAVDVAAGGAVVARGLTNYGSEPLSRIVGVHTERIREILGFKDFDEVVHRDNLVLLRRSA